MHAENIGVADIGVICIGFYSRSRRGGKYTKIGVSFVLVFVWKWSIFVLVFVVYVNLKCQKY